MSRISLDNKLNISESVYLKLKDNIIKGIWKRGEKIPSEMSLSKTYGVSRNTIRFCIQRLNAMGLVKTKHGGGTTVIETIYDEELINILPMMQLNEHEWIDIIRYRTIVEVAMLRLAAINRTEDDLVNLRESIESLVKSVSSKQRNDISALADLHFHISIAKASKNKTYFNMVIKMQEIWFRQQKQSRVYFDTDYVDFHVRIYDAIKHRDIIKAQRFMKAHLEYKVDEIINNNTFFYE